MSLVLDAETHTYSDGTPRKWVSVSRVIDAVMKKSFEGVSPEVLENAAERGRRTEDYCTEILKTGGCSMPGTERRDVEERVTAFYDWYSQVKPIFIDAQRIVSNESDGVAGCADFLVRMPDTHRVCLPDLKCTASVEKTWALQLGAYMTYCPEAQDCAILHLNPKFVKGWIWRAYDPLIVKSQWASALNWFKTLQSLKAEA